MRMFFPECLPRGRAARSWRAGVVGACLAWSLVAGCGGGTSSGTTRTVDVVNYFPLELGRYGVYFNQDGRFLTLSFTRMDTVVGFEVFVLEFAFTKDPEQLAQVSPAYEEYYALDPDQGVLWYGYKDYELGESASFSPGVLFAGNEMVLEEPVVTATAVSGRLERYVTTLVAYGIVEAYYGTFSDAVDVTVGPEGGDQPKHFLARNVGLVEFDWKGVHYQLYDYGGAVGGAE